MYISRNYTGGRFARRVVQGFITVMLFLAIPATQAGRPRPVFVPARAGWVESGVTVVAGDSITIAARGQAITGPLRLFPLARSGPDGQVTDCDDTVVISCSECAADLLPYGALIGRIDGALFLIGSGGTFTASASGTLYLAVNDNVGCYDDNRGGFIVLIRSHRD